jgi:hypothetical protein
MAYLSSEQLMPGDRVAFLKVIDYPIIKAVFHPDKIFIIEMQ